MAITGMLTQEEAWRMGKRRPSYFLPNRFCFEGIEIVGTGDSMYIVDLDFNAKFDRAFSFEQQKRIYAEFGY